MKCMQTIEQMEIVGGSEHCESKFVDRRAQYLYSSPPDSEATLFWSVGPYKERLRVGPCQAGFTWITLETTPGYLILLIIGMHGPHKIRLV